MVGRNPCCDAALAADGTQDAGATSRQATHTLFANASVVAVERRNTGASASAAGSRVRKALVEDACQLSLSRVREAIATRHSVLLVRRPGAAEPLRVGLTLVEGSYGPAVNIAYEVQGEAVTYALRLVAIRQHFGMRPLFACPLLTQDRTPCSRRARALYLPPGRRYFGCVRCHGLTYRSVQYPLASRLRGVAVRLEQYRRDLQSGDCAVQARALEGASATIAMLLGRVEDPQLRNTST
jgi:hypothetical protein